MSRSRGCCRCGLFQVEQLGIVELCDYCRACYSQMDWCDRQMRACIDVEWAGCGFVVKIGQKSDLNIGLGDANGVEG